MSAVYGGAGGQNVSPDLSWDAPPVGTKSLAITCHDPDAPTTVGFTHWVLFNLPPDLKSLPAGAGAAGKIPKGATLGFTDYGESAYGGMAPPPGDPPHRYQFTVWALDVPRLEGGDERTTYAKFRFLIRGHVLAQGALTGLFGRKG
jgi:Raf kinase inhibitor-like YbhB/YbcL family protein